MLFNSFEFIFGFIPLTLLGFILLTRWRSRPLPSQPVTRTRVMIWMVAASLFFYGWWNPWNLPLIIGSIGLNYGLGLQLNNGQLSKMGRRGLLIGGIIINLASIGYFKYAGFFLEILGSLSGRTFTGPELELPLGISFFTFQQIAYLIDTYRQETKNYSFIQYALFVSFFPQLIAGPIVHHRDVAEQFHDRNTFKFSKTNLETAITIFAIGLFKKVMLADAVSVYANPIFAAAETGETFGFTVAWLGALAYGMQLYFDFSAYSDMATGAAYAFGIRLPLNFDSPYKAISITQFWQRWHITLSRFLRDYLYIPLGGNRKGEPRRYFNVLITMLLGGLWHGAGWTFIVWGGIHGLMLIINYIWRYLENKLWRSPPTSPPQTQSPLKFLQNLIGWLITFLAVQWTWIFFRAETLQGGWAIASSALGLNGFDLPEDWPELLGTDAITGWITVSILLAIALLAPNIQQWLGDRRVTLTAPRPERAIAAPLNPILEKITWSPHPLWAIICGVMAVTAILNMTRLQEFLYFQF